MSNLLHRAIINNDLDKVHDLTKNKDLLREKNQWGLSPVELAHFLGRKACIKLLQQEKECFIFVQKKGEQTISEIKEEDFSSFFNCHYYRFPRFRNYRELLETLQQFPFILQIPFFAEENVNFAKIHAEKLKNGETAKTSIRFINPEIGYGLYTENDLQKGDWIGEYTGLVRQLYRFHADQNRYCVHYPTKFWSWHYMMIDAYAGGNELRFVNHSDDPNLQPKWLITGRLLRFVLFAKRAIKKNEQLTFNYGEDFWRKRKKKKKF